MYVLSLAGSQRGTTPIRRKNPFTGQDIELLPWVVGAEDAAAAAEVLGRHGASEVDGASRVTVGDGSTVEIRKGADAGASWTVSFSQTLQALGTDAMQLLFELAAAGHFVIDGDDVAIVTSTQAKQRFDAGELVDSPARLASLLRTGS